MRYWLCPSLERPCLGRASKPLLRVSLFQASMVARLLRLSRAISFTPNFHEKAHFVKADVAASVVAERNGSLPFALCFHPHSLVSHSFGDSVHMMRSVFSDYQEGAAIF